MYSLRWTLVRSPLGSEVSDVVGHHGNGRLPYHSLRLMAVSRVHPPWGFLASHSLSLGSDSLASLSTSSGGNGFLVHPADAPATKAVMSTAGPSIVSK